MVRSDIIRFGAIVLVAVALASAVAPARAAQPADFSTTLGSIGTAYVAVAHAQHEGGNVSGLVASLNVALSLYLQAQTENAADPAKASTDLQNATLVAQQVALAAPGVGQSGLVARQTQEYLSVGSAVAIVVVAALLYLYGDRIYRRLWIRLYGGHLVKGVG